MSGTENYLERLKDIRKRYGCLPNEEVNHFGGLGSQRGTSMSNLELTNEKYRENVQNVEPSKFNLRNCYYQKNLNI